MSNMNPPILSTIGSSPRTKIVSSPSKTKQKIDVAISPLIQETSMLIGKWDLYYHLPYDKNWDIASYKKIMENIDSVEKLILINESLNERIVKNCMLFVMRKGITPLWEDVQNRNGGCFSFKVINKQVKSVWESLFFAMCGETLCIDKKNNDLINGITISPKKNFCIIKILLKNL